MQVFLGVLEVETSCNISLSPLTSALGPNAALVLQQEGVLRGVLKADVLAINRLLGVLLEGVLGVVVVREALVANEDEEMTWVVKGLVCELAAIVSILRMEHC